ncbi:MAG: DUF1559 domain-containing protein [Planctomycetales bacterium]|nr:DUF1559 domain-containing protein [Planctomycetales bacterium]
MRQLLGPKRNAFTLLELLVVIAIISLLVQLLLPAIQSARESARIVTCRNNLRQIGMGVLAHEAALGHFPSGGWNWHWCGDPHRGFDRDQPGSWIYNVLPYLDENDLRSIGADKQGDEKLAALVTLQQQPLSLFTCPSRRDVEGFPNIRINDRFKNAGFSEVHARSDYAGNGGSIYTNLGAGPRSYPDAEKFQWKKGNNTSRANGIFYSRSLVKGRHIRDGLSKTYLVGEKSLSTDAYESGSDLGDDSSMFQGDDADNTRWTSPTITDEYWIIIERPNTPRNDSYHSPSSYSFGSAHMSGWNAVRCDGSAQFVSYSMDSKVHASLGNRADRR